MDKKSSELVIVEGIPLEMEEIRREALKEARRELPRQSPGGIGEAGYRETWADCAAMLLLFLGFCVTFLAMAGGASWIHHDVQAAFTPEEFFDPLPDCLVLNVTQTFVNNSASCSDRYLYEFTPEPFANVVRVVVQAEEFVRSSSDLCGDPSAVGLERARFKIGDKKQCLVLQEFFQGYMGSFNCASPSPPCYSMLDITSSYDPTLAQALGSVIIVVFGIIPSLAVLLSPYFVTSTGVN